MQQSSKMLSRYDIIQSLIFNHDLFNLFFYIQSQIVVKILETLSYLLTHFTFLLSTFYFILYFISCYLSCWAFHSYCKSLYTFSCRCQIRYTNYVNLSNTAWNSPFILVLAAYVWKNQHKYQSISKWNKV